MLDAHVSLATMPTFNQTLEKKSPCFANVLSKTMNESNEQLVKLKFSTYRQQVKWIFFILKSWHTSVFFEVLF